MQKNKLLTKKPNFSLKLLICIFLIFQSQNAKAIESSSIIKGLAVGIPTTLAGFLAYDVATQIDKIKPRKRKNGKTHSRLAIAVKRSISKLKPNIEKISALCLGASVIAAFLIEMNRNQKTPDRIQKIVFVREAKPTDGIRSSLFDLNNTAKFPLSDQIFIREYRGPGRTRVEQGRVLSLMHYLFGIDENNFFNHMDLKERIKALDSIKYDDGRSFWDLIGLESHNPCYQACIKIAKLDASEEIPQELLQAIIDNIKIFDHKLLDQLAQAESINYPSSSRFTIICGAKLQQIVRCCPETFDQSAFVTASRFSTGEGLTDCKTKSTPSFWQIDSVQGETGGSMSSSGVIKRLGLDQRAMHELHQRTDSGAPFINLAPDLISTRDSEYVQGETEHRVKEDATTTDLDSLKILYEPPSQIMFWAEKNGSTLEKCPRKIMAAQIPVFAINCKYWPEKQPMTYEQISVATELLKHQMLGAVQVAHLHGHKKIFLTGVGLNAFKNELSWYLPALKEALEFAKSKNMDVGLIALESPDKDLPREAFNVGTTIMGLDVAFATTPAEVTTRFQ